MTGVIINERVTNSCVDSKNDIELLHFLIFHHTPLVKSSVSNDNSIPIW